MELFKRQLAYIDSLEFEFYDTLKEIISKFDFVIKDYVTNKQLFQKGIDGKGKKLEGYARTTIKLKLRKQDPSDRTTLRDEGAFYANFKIDAFEDRFEISSDVSYAKYLVKRYGPDIMKPSVENMTEFINNYFLPNIKSKISGQFTE